MPSQWEIVHHHALNKCHTVILNDLYLAKSVVTLYKVCSFIYFEHSHNKLDGFSFLQQNVG